MICFVVGLHMRWKEINHKNREFLDTQITGQTQGEMSQNEDDIQDMDQVVLHECQVR